ncbi:hypothetical protein MMC27_003996 [Xylographa pallens]|nr:hypothetical protein [Xylographa pallens]
MAPISTKKEQERSQVYSSHGISASRFNTDEILGHPALTLETLKRKQENEKKKESAPVQQKSTPPIKNDGRVKITKIQGECKPQPEATRSSPPNAAYTDSVHRPTPKDDVLMLPDDFELLGTTKSKCLDPLDELCKALRVPYTVLDVFSGPRQAQGPTTKRIYRRDEVGDSLDPTLQNFEKATSEEYKEDYVVSIEKVGSDNRSPAQRFWDTYYPLIIVLGVVAVPVGGFLLTCLGACCSVFCGANYEEEIQKHEAEREKRRRMRKAKKAEEAAKRRRKSSVRLGLIEADIELEIVNKVWNMYPS